MEYTKRRNLNRGYMKLDVWQRGMELFKLTFQLTNAVPDFKLRSQIWNAAQSVSANVAEGYGRRSLPEYIQFLYNAKGSLAEALTRAIGLQISGIVSNDDFEEFDKLHYEVENKLLALIESMESKRNTGSWSDALPTSNRPVRQSTNIKPNNRPQPITKPQPLRNFGNPPIQ